MTLNHASKGQGHILVPSDYITSTWSGGFTTELASYPAGADVSNQHFLWRVSIATVSKDGPFTRFEKTQRVLMVLKGAIHLTHDEERDCALLPFDQDRFYGNVQTVAKIGQQGATNLNLMFKEGAKGELQHIGLESGQTQNYLLHDVADEPFPRLSQAVDLLYNVDGEIQIHHSNTAQEFIIHSGESFLFSRDYLANNDGKLLIHNVDKTLANIVAVRIIYA